MSSPDINYPSTPSYGESLAEALKAQAEFLQGTGDFEETGSLESLLPLEESVRKKTAQTDTDVLRQTLLGTRQEETKGTYDDEGRLVVGYEDGKSAETKEITPNISFRQATKAKDGVDGGFFISGGARDPDYHLSVMEFKDSDDNIVHTKYITSEKTAGALERTFNSASSVEDFLGDRDVHGFADEFKDVQLLKDKPGLKYGDSNVNKIEITVPRTDSTPIYGKDPDGNVITDKSKAGQTETIPASFSNDGLINLLGDSRNLQETRKLSKDEQALRLVEQNPELNALYNKVQSDQDPTNEFFGLSKTEAGRKLLDDNDGSVEKIAEKYGISNLTMPEFGQVDSGRQAGFDADGNFLGLSTLAEDLQRGNLSRQREADLADVERLSQRYQDVMADFAPGTQEALTGARNILNAQEDTLTGAGAISEPTGTTFADGLTGQTMDAATVANTPSLSADTSFDAATVGQRDALTADTSYDALNQITGPTLGAGTTYTASGVRAPGALTADTSFDPSASVTGGTFDRGTTYQASQVADPLALSAATSFDPSANVAGQTYGAARAADPMALTAATSFDPSASMTGTSFDAALAGDPMALTAATSYDPSANVTGRGYTATAGLDAGQIGADPLRQALMGQAMTAVDQGLTDREIAQIENAARARSTLSGRTFDQQSAINEAQAVIAEDNARRMQNRGFAQGVLGQEADLQQSDLARGLQAQMQNQAALNQAAQYGASQDMQAQLANQAATNQARQAGITAGLSQEALAAQQRQAQEFANQASRNRAGEFAATTAMEAQRANQAATNQALQAGLQAGLQQESLAAQQAQAVALADQAAQNRASEFGASSAMEAARANQAAINQARSQGLEAGLAQEALAASQAQTKAMADAQAANRAAEFGVSAGLEQQTQANQAALQAQLANQQAQNQAAQFGVQAGLQQEQLGAQLAQAKSLADAQAVNRAREFGVQAGIGQEQTQAQLAQQAALANLGAEQQRQESGLQAGLAQEQLGAQLDQQRALADAQNLQQARAMGLTAGLEQDALRAQLGQAQNLAQAELDQQASAFGAQSAQQAALANQAQQQQANQFGIGAQMDAERLNEQLKQSGTLGYIDAATRLAALEDQATLDPFQALLGRGGGQSLQAGQGVLGQAGYGLQSAPQYLNPEAGLGFISQMAANDANIAAAQASAQGSAMGGLFGGLGSLGGGLFGGLASAGKIF